MTLPTNIILPEPTDFQTNPNLYVDNLVNKLEDMYESISINVNGIYRNNIDLDGSSWIPTLSGSTSAGSYTYTKQVAWVFRQGLLNDVWASISWSATTATGQLLINLPYEVIKSSIGLSFNGTCTTSGITYASGTSATISTISSTYTANIVTYGSGIASAILNVPASGTIDFHIRYIGDTDE